MTSDHNHLSVEFAAISHGYLGKHASDLPALLAKLPWPVSLREQGIRSAIEHGVAFPTAWERNRAPIRGLKRPSELIARYAG